MIVSLRKRHQRMWLGLAIVIPILFIYAVVNRADGNGEGAVTSTAGILSEKGNLQVLVQAPQLKIDVLQPLRSAHSEVYIALGSSCDQQVFLGTLQNRGSYVFDIPINTDICELRVMDAINHVEVDKVMIR